MKLYLCGHDDRYAIEQLQLALFPDEPMEPCDAPFDGDGAVSTLFCGETWLTATAHITLSGKTAKATRRMKTAQADIPTRRRLLQNAYYDAAIQLRKAPDWGSLSGVRPSKLTTKYMLEGHSARSAQKLLEKNYHVTSERSRLCTECSSATLDAASRLRKDDISVYIGIPFCPTRCAYCSFVSAGIEKAGKLIEPFLEALEREIAHVGALLKASNKHIRTLYIGGGTPTTLSTSQMQRLMQAISANFDLSELIEYTVEGGRPDTLSFNKLKTIRSFGCNRMSINPQSMNDAVLKAIGRCHSGEQTVNAFHAAVNAGFEGINMDLIAGLPEEDEASFAASLEKVLSLAPSNITVHTLAMKKGADLYFARMGLPSAEAVRNMLDHADRRLRENGYRPYYLYRQKYMSGSFENIGWCKDGFEGLYNIYMMEEMHSIISLGGGAMTKINLSDGTLERFHNPKYPQQYIERIDEILEQKTAAFALLP
ncbi:MAG: coproporphyrinogen dehydrogenase HemZ [Ruminococcaceae bacterium]|nr:coproporphyrinogen dehydrogenase HemZ [Oscillospiraceae bacterium]